MGALKATGGQLLQYATSRLAEGGTLSVHVMAMTVLRQIVEDDQPTPQPAWTEDGGVEIVWLVNEEEVTITINPDGNGTFRHTYSFAQVGVVDHSSSISFQVSDVPESVRSWSRTYLGRMGKDVKHRLVLQRAAA